MTEASLANGLRASQVTQLSAIRIHQSHPELGCAMGFDDGREVIKAAFRRADPVGLTSKTPDYGEGLLITCLNNHIPDPMHCRTKASFGTMRPTFGRAP